MDFFFKFLEPTASLLLILCRGIMCIILCSFLKAVTHSVKFNHVQKIEYYTQLSLKDPTTSKLLVFCSSTLKSDKSQVDNCFIIEILFRSRKITCQILKFTFLLEISLNVNLCQ